MSSIIVAKVVVSFVNLLHKPKEGIFNRTKLDKDYCYWSLRSVIKKWPVWLARQLSLPLFEMIAFKILGVKTSFSNSLNEGWVDCEFVEFGKNIKIGQGSLIMSNIIVQDKLIIKKVIIKDNVIIGAHAVVLPGTIIEQNTILDVISMTTMNQYLERDSIYCGVPAKKIEKSKSNNNLDALKTSIFEKEFEQEVNEEFLRAHVKELSVPFHFYVITGWIIIGCSFIIPGFLFILFLFVFLIPNTLSTALSVESYLSLNLIILLLTPLIIIGIYLFHLFFVALFTKWFYKLADKRGPEQGVYDRNLDESSTVLDYYHFGSFLFKYPIFAFMRSPFPWLINWELNFIGSNQVKKNTIFEETFFHSHIKFGKNCYMGTFTHITNHVVDGVYGEENLTFFGAKVCNNCVLSASNGALPGLEMGNNSTILPMCATIKYDKLGNNGIYGGFPAKKLDKNEISKIFGGEYHGE
ncbi:MAG: hypothetical protein ACFFAQ_08400 [Promethearchaeota archaeon]